MVENSNDSLGELASRLKDAMFLKDAGYYFIEDSLFIPVPQWEGWKQIESANEGTMDHFARWEIFFPPGEERWWVFLRITWPSITQILLGFVYPDDDKILEEIALHRRLALLDLPLMGGQPHPSSKGVMVHDIPTDVLRVIGIGPGCATNSDH